LLDKAPVARDAVWRAGQVLTVGKTRLCFDYPAALALVELEQSPDERMRPGEAEAAPGEEPAPTPPPPSSAALPLPPSSEWMDGPTRGALAKKPKPEGAWSTADALVVLLALGVLVLSGLGAMWLFARTEATRSPATSFLP